MPTDYRPGSTLEIRGEQWSLSRAQRFDSCRLLTLSGAEPSNAARTLRVIDPFDRPRPITRRKLRRRPRRAVLQAALGAVASARTTHGLWSASAASIDILPYQLEPALAIVDGCTRLLLADAVGLGKTIQAGLIVAELYARGWIERTLIVCPCGLRDTWAHELRERFHLTAAVVDQSALADRIATLPPGVNPWSTDAIVIVSIDLLKRPEVLAAVDRVPIDLLIADEAHHLTPATDRGAAVSRLAGRSPWVVLLSATPHSGDAAAFSYLTAIGGHNEGLTVFRRTRHDAGTVTRRRTHLLPVQPAGDERALFAAVDRYVQAIWHGRGPADRAVRLVAITLARRAASSLDALTHSLARRLALLSGEAIREPEQGLLPWDESDLADAIEGDGVLAARGLDDPAVERRSLEQLLELARSCATSSKIRRLLRMLRAIREPVLVFTEFRDTLHAIASRLDASRCCVIHGGMPADARRDATARFNDGRADILLATDAAGEGLNLHHRCRLVIDVELPWNPLRLEQRFGRVDRIGQRRTVHAVRLFHPATIEARVLEHLRIRRRCAEAAMNLCAGEQEVAEAMFDNRIIASGPTMPRTRVLERAGMEATRIERQRTARLLGASAAVRCWMPARSGPLFTVHRTTFLNEAGLPIADRIEAQHIDLARTPANRREWRRLIERLADLPTSADSSSAPASLRAELTERIAAIRAMVAHRSLVEYQRSLFDGRADAEAADRDRTAAHLDAALDRLLRAATSPGAVRAQRELIAAWPGRTG
jgi:superfamily II DNA or RNA helicase